MGQEFGSSVGPGGEGSHLSRGTLLPYFQRDTGASRKETAEREGLRQPYLRTDVAGQLPHRGI